MSAVDRIREQYAQGQQIDALYAQVLTYQRENRALQAENAALIRLIGVLMYPCTTEAQLLARRDALVQIHGRTH